MIAFLQILPVLIIIFLIIYIAQPTQMQIKDNALHILGLYGKTIELNRIRQINLSDAIPEILFRNNGLGLGSIKKGYFELKDVGRCSLYLNGSYTPYLHLQTYDGEIIIFNNKDEESILHIYNEIRKRV